MRSFSETYLKEYASPRNKKGARQRKETAFRALNRKIGKLTLEEVTPAQIHHYVRQRKAEVSDVSINREIAVLKHMLNYAVETQVLDTNRIEKFKLLREVQTQRKRITDEQIDAVICCLPTGMPADVRLHAGNRLSKRGSLYADPRPGA